MNEGDKRKINEIYNHRLNKLGHSFDALSSGTEERRAIRFDVLTEIGIKSGDSVLDLGCGFGDYFKYLKDNGILVKYTGIDINPTFINSAIERYPDAEFKVLDIQSEDPGQYDYVVSTSCFNYILDEQNNYEFAGEILKRSYLFAKKGVAIDFTTDYVDFKGLEGTAFYYSPEKMFGIGKKITKRVLLRHDYPLFEFCIYLYPDFKGWTKK